jgi:hypothetical protein
MKIKLDENTQASLSQGQLKSEYILMFSDPPKLDLPATDQPIFAFNVTRFCFVTLSNVTRYAIWWFLFSTFQINYEKNSLYRFNNSKLLVG